MGITFIDLFAGVGGFRKGMEFAGHKCIGVCEFDKFAIASYTSMHLITDEQREYLSTLPIKRRQKEILKDEYRNGEWYANDIRRVDARSMPRANCWCFGAPCQDFSVAGSRFGLEGDRSSLVREVFRILEEFEEEDRPKWLIYENVKGMLSSNGGLDYLSILSEMDRLGYDLEWQNINSCWYVPQNRERIYTIGHLRRYGIRKILPITGTDGENHLEQIGNFMPTATRENPNQGRIYDTSGIAPCLNKMDGGGREPHISVVCNTNPSGRGMNGNVYDSTYLNPALTTNKGEGNKIAIPVLTPDRDNKRQNGRRFKEDGEPMFTLTGQDKHGVMIQVSEDIAVYAVWVEKYNCYMAIRKLTPRECFRLQDWTDDYFEKAEFVNSDSQLYKQAGNGVTVSVIQAIAERLDN